MVDIKMEKEFLNGIALVKKKGNKIFIVESPLGEGGETPIILNGILCYDKWKDQYENTVVVDKEGYIDENGNTIPDETHIEKKLVLKAGNRYGIRYEEALALECAYLRSEINALKTFLKNKILI